ncbi:MULTISPECIES: Crp/Fnr family transcriptional regulator [Bacteroidaceae]|uniref:Crp/Fnr family transcriptional regulator n=1 Tax=Bacteroidaceae TaxID=815 RepID=UPI001A2B1759|nr:MULTISPECIES: Crp/Fnr family transcriptional regulator [Bacteroidaceae]MBJ2195882.1 Crp/Fnr family transcriptional regulator [Muribaculaceae bacterium]
MEIKEIINRRHILPEDSLALLCRSMELVHYPKGHHVLEIGKIERDIYFISKGIVRAFTLVDGKEVTFWVGKEGATIVSMMGYVKNEPGYETMELMEDSELYVIKRAKLQQLYNEDIHIANWGRRFAETELLDAEVRVITLLLATATERYRDLLDNQSDLLQRLPLGCIASYLGITQVSLSRIRASIAKGNKQSI